MAGRSVALVAAVLVSAVLTCSPQGSSAAPPTGGSSDAGQAQSAANQADARVATLDAGVRRAAARLASLTRTANAAQRQVDVQLALQRAEALAVAAAETTARTAAARYASAHAAFVATVAVQYEGSGAAIVSGAGQLLVASDPGQFLATSEMTTMVARYRADVTARNQSAARASAAAAGALESALRSRRATTARLQAARDTAQRQMASAAASLRTLRSGLTAARLDQARTDAVLSRFLGGWSLADPARADALNRRYLDLARSQRNRPMAPVSAHWTAAQGQSVVRRALRWIGTPYAWAGGDAAGPTTGRCVAGDAANDCHVTGFDCSGLALYAWAPYAAMPHLASAQYRSAGRLHPAITALLPGDLVFWSSDGTVTGIHHVAIYLGDGNVLQAPNSGDIVRVTPLGSVDAGYFGATRPRT